MPALVRQDVQLRTVPPVADSTFDAAGRTGSQPLAITREHRHGPLLHDQHQGEIVTRWDRVGVDDLLGGGLRVGCVDEPIDLR